MAQRWPVLFVSHGAPTVALETNGYTQALAAFGSGLGVPRAVVVVSAHWEWPGPARVNAVARPSIIHDFSGFPPEMYALTYAAPGAPDLADEALDLLASAGIHAVPETARGWDHGVWVPLRLMYPGANAPVVEISLPIPRSPERLLRLGRSLAPLREQGVLLMGSGGVVHNLRRLHREDDPAPPAAWAAEFDTWVAERIESRAFDEILRYRERAPNAEEAVPTTEHFDPLFFVLGAARGDDHPTWIHESFRYGTLSMRTLVLEGA
jgi:4,5-DOPA dioxygenase extradiol